MRRIGKIATCCLIGTVAFAGRTIVTQAAEIPIAGMDVILDEFYQSDSDLTYIKEYLTSAAEFENIGIANVTNYVNIRRKPNEESKILGKLYSDSAATILAEKDGWYKVESGSVTGYIKAEFLTTGDEVKELAKKVGKRIATVNTTTLKVRENPDLESIVLTLVPIEEELSVRKELDGWVKVTIDADVIGYVSAEYVDLRTEFKEAESIEEEKARLEREEAERRAQEEANNRATYSNSSVSNSSSSNSSGYSNASSGNSSSSSSSSNYSGNSSLRLNIVNYATRFLGNPYVWGGTSLTNGADCSGFTQSVFRDNGVSIPRDSRSQAAGGSTISINNIQAGDLIFYSRNGVINHVAIYMGNGKVIHASSPETGIRITNYNYRQPVKAVRYIN
ncbi:C40 family peptidase [Anaerocolumna aminovalerica]|uniref:C40 family peptidase n=1 Tax=Anaerocolumna aminovalerica TaxID=1527 RepID=UPI000BE3C4C7|nr:C40 family peptidase [Anaerocolumna aminovalerica]